MLRFRSCYAEFALSVEPKRLLLMGMKRDGVEYWLFILRERRYLVQGWRIHKILHALQWRFIVIYRKGKFSLLFFDEDCSKSCSPHCRNSFLNVASRMATPLIMLQYHSCAHSLSRVLLPLRKDSSVQYTLDVVLFCLEQFSFGSRWVPLPAAHQHSCASNFCR